VPNFWRRNTAYVHINDEATSMTVAHRRIRIASLQFHISPQKEAGHCNAYLRTKRDSQMQPEERHNRVMWGFHAQKKGSRKAAEEASRDRSELMETYGMTQQDTSHVLWNRTLHTIFPWCDRAHSFRANKLAYHTEIPCPQSPISIFDARAIGRVTRCRTSGERH
jgi:hypothetical protein